MAKRFGISRPSDGLGYVIPHSHRFRKEWVVPIPKAVHRSSIVSPNSYLTRSWTYTNPNGSILSQGTQTDPGTSFVRTNSFSGVTNPYWKDQIRAGGNAGTVASGTRYTFDLGWITASIDSYNNANPPTRFATDWYGYPSIPAPGNSSPAASVLTAVNNRAISKFLDRVDSAMSSVESGQDFGEIRQSLDSMVNPLGSLRRHVLSYFSSLRKLRRYRKSRDLKKALADTYLEWTFGWKPLAQDIAAAYVGLQNRKRFFNIVPVNAHAKMHYAGSNTSQLAATSSDSQLELWQNTKSNSSYYVRYKGVVRTGAIGGAKSVGDVLQLDLPHFLPTAWDLLPYSFIIDYFVNVGDIIRAYSFRRSSIAWCMQTTRTVDRSDIQSEIRQRTTPVGWRVQSYLRGDCNSFVERSSFTRQPVSPGILIPDLTFSIPVSQKPWINIDFLILANLKTLVPFFAGK